MQEIAHRSFRQPQLLGELLDRGRQRHVLLQRRQDPLPQPLVFRIGRGVVARTPHSGARDFNLAALRQLAHDLPEDRLRQAHMQALRQARDFQAE